MDTARRPRAWKAMSRLLARCRVRAVDALLAVGLAFAFSEPGFDSYHHDSGRLWATAGLLGAAALAWRRSAPRTVWLITTATGTWLLATRHGPDWGGLSPLVLIPSAMAGLYSLASQAGRGPDRLAAALTLACLEFGLLVHPARGEAVVTVAALAAASLAAGRSAWYRDRVRKAERAASDVRAAADERGRIARELHDILAHHVSIISLQAGTARLLAEAGTPPDISLLAGIESASRQAMAELRHTLGVIRHTPGGTQPAATLDRLPELAAGTGLAVTIDGSARPSAAPGGDVTSPLPAAIELTAYRVVQESLTNVLRHSTAASARVTLRRTDTALHLRVTDDGPARAKRTTRTRPASWPDGGRGLPGLSERVQAHGGELHAGPRADGTAGFEVRAVLPVPPQGLAEQAPSLLPADPPSATASAKDGTG